MRSVLLLAALIGQLMTRAVVAQTPPQLTQRLNARALAALRPIFDSARIDSLPIPTLEDKALEGSAKHVPVTRIVAAVRQLATDLRDARKILRSAAPGATLSDGEITAAADARHRGVPATEIAALRSHVRQTTELVVALTVLGDFVQRGVAAGQGRAVIEQLLATGMHPSQIAELPSRVDVGLRLGALPADALRNALPLPLRGSKPGKPPPGGPPKPKVPSHP